MNNLAAKAKSKDQESRPRQIMNGAWRAGSQELSGANPLCRKNASLGH